MRGGAQPAAIVVLAVEEDAGQLAALVFALFDPQGHLVAEIGELAHLDRRAQRAGAQFEAQSFVIVPRIGLDEADDAEIDRGERDRIHIRHAQQPAIAHAQPAHDVQLGRDRQLAEREQYPEQQPDRHAEAEIFGQQIGQHSPDDAQRPAFGRHEIEQPANAVEHQQHRRDRQRGDQRHRDQPGHIAIDGFHRRTGWT